MSGQEVMSLQVDQRGRYVLGVRWTAGGQRRYVSEIEAVPGWSTVAIRWQRYGLGVQKEVAIEIEVRNAESLKTNPGVQRYSVKDILDTVNNVGGGVELFGHQGQKY